MGHNFTEYGAQCAGAEWVVVRESQMMFATDLCREAAVQTDLPDKLVAVSTAKGLFQIGRAEITRQLHARR